MRKAKFWADGRQTLPWDYFPLARDPSSERNWSIRDVSHQSASNGPLGGFSGCCSRLLAPGPIVQLPLLVLSYHPLESREGHVTDKENLGPILSAGSLEAGAD